MDLEEKDLKKIEWLLKKEEESNEDVNTDYNPNYENVTKFNTERTIIDNVDHKTFETLSEDIMELLDTSIAVYEKNGDYAYGQFNSTWCQLMDSSSFNLCNTTNTKKALTCGEWLCHENCWHDSAKECIKTGEPTDIECVGGIHLYAEPIKAKNKIIGSINIGYGDPPQDEQTLIELAKKYNIDKKEIFKRSKDYKSRPLFIIKNAKKRLRTVALLIGQIIENNQHKEQYHEINKDLLSQNEEYETLNEELRQANHELLTTKQSLEKSEELLNATGSMAKVGGWELNLKTNEVEWTKATAEIHEVPEGYVPKLDEALKFYPGDTKHIIRNAVTQALEKGIHYDLTVPFRTAKGRNIWVRAIGKPVFKKGKCVRLHGTFQDITETHTTQLELQEREALLKRTESIANIGSWDWDIASDTVTWSDELFRIFGRNQQKGAVSYAEHHKVYTPESMKILDESVQQTIKSGKSYDIDVNIIRSNGEIAHCVARGYAKKNVNDQVVGLYGSFQDLTHRKTLEERLKDVVDSSPFPLAIADTQDQHIFYWSQSAIKMFGHTPDKVEEWFRLAYPDPIYRKDVIERWKPFVEKAANSKEALNTGEYDISCKNGSVKTCDIYINLIPGYMVVTMNDITEKKESELILKEVNEELASQNKEYENLNEELQQTIEELQLAKEKAEESDRLKSAFLANMSHEIRTPMNGILGFTNLLNKPELSGEKQEKFIAVIQESGNRMLNTINDIIEISKIEAGDIKPVYEKVNINEQLEYYYEFFKPEVDNKGMELLVNIMLEDNKATIITETSMFHSIFTNLIKNAIKYSDGGSVEFGYNLHKQNELKFYVKDTGIGIAKEKYDVIFDRFMQACALNEARSLN